MKITVQRSGGVAGMERVWSVQAVTPDDRDQWQPLIEACPWDDLPGPAAAESGGIPQPDRFVYRIRAGQRRATLPERDLVGPWRTLVDSMRAAAESLAQPEPASGGAETRDRPDGQPG
ncbi:protealysin inhibitor emfourin [Arthrobacter sp. YAF16]|uniref:protealysin inhibitor emfourin n=1 Tax=Arthrobacter sp. YAF16 TaxID=3233076 RepID=UPI003F916692